jgi:hypothetical protein
MQKVKFYPEFCEAMADGLNMVGIFGGVTTKECRVDIYEPLIEHHVSVTPELILEYTDYHQRAQNDLLKSDDLFMVPVVDTSGLESIVYFEEGDIKVLQVVIDKILAGARGELVPDLSGEMYVDDGGDPCSEMDLDDEEMEDVSMADRP